MTRTKLAGYQLAPTDEFTSDLMAYLQDASTGKLNGPPPSPAKPIYTDGKGQFFAREAGENEVAEVPLQPSAGQLEGIKPLTEMPQPAGRDAAQDMLANLVDAVPPSLLGDWLDKTATTAMFASAPGGAMDEAMRMVGMTNPLSGTAVGQALSQAANVAAMGPVGGLLGSVLRGGGDGAVQSMATVGLRGLLGGGQGPAGPSVNAALSAMLSGGCCGRLEAASDKFSSMVADTNGLPDRIPGTPGINPNASGGAGMGRVTGQALGQAADHLLSQWQVDDESSAAEHIAQRAVNENKGAIKEALANPSEMSKKIREFFGGKTSSASLPAARISDPDITKPEVLSTGESNILAEGLPISRVSDKLSPSQSPVSDGAAMVLSAGLPTARATAPTIAPGVMMENGAANVLVGDTGSGDAAAPPANAETSSNGGPAGPDGPASPAGGSGGSSSGSPSVAQGEGDANTTAVEALPQLDRGDGGLPTDGPPSQPPLANSLTDQERFDQWYEQEKSDGLGWTDELPDCPKRLECETDTRTVHTKYGAHKIERIDCETPDATVWGSRHDPNYWGEYHPGAEHGIRTNTPEGEPGNQCTYDAGGNLIMDGPGAGTADRSSPGSSRSVSDVYGNLMSDGGHRERDVKPYDLALELDGGAPGDNVDKYLEVRPTQQGIDEYRKSQQESDR